MDYTPKELADILEGLAQEQHDLAEALGGTTDENEKDICRTLRRRAGALDQIIKETGLGGL